MNLPPLAADQPGLLELLFNPQAMSLWELIRLHRKPITLIEISAAAGMEPATVQPRLDELLRQRLIQSVRARGPRTALGYKVARDELVVAYDLDDKPFMDRMKALNLQASESHFHQVVARFGDRNADPRTTWRFGAYGTAHLEVDDLRELSRRIHAVDEFINVISAKRAASRPVSNGKFRAPHCNHAICIRVEPLHGPVLQQPDISLISREKAASGVTPRPASVRSQLSPRENEVARAMATGLARHRIAAHLGLSAHTVNTLVKRIYRKLGVHTQAELIARLASNSPSKEPD
jgi:DNA-binding CsgD family transcriptional regulator